MQEIGTVRDKDLPGTPVPTRKKMDVSPVPTISYVKAFKLAPYWNNHEQPDLFLVETGVPHLQGAVALVGPAKGLRGDVDLN